jgi:hypothetical protein
LLRMHPQSIDQMVRTPSSAAKQHQRCIAAFGPEPFECGENRAQSLRGSIVPTTRYAPPKERRNASLTC